MGSYLLSKKTRNERFSEYVQGGILCDLTLNMNFEAIRALRGVTQNSNEEFKW